MNYAKGIETAFARTIRRFCEVGADTAVRPWQSLPVDPSWKPVSRNKDDPYGDRVFPMVDIRTGPPSTEDHLTMTSATTIQIGTLPQADRDHSVASGIYGEIHDLLDDMRSQHYKGVDGDELAYFRAELAAELGSDFSFGGVSWGDGAPPVDAGGYNVITLAYNVHHARGDY